MWAFSYNVHTLEFEAASVIFSMTHRKPKRSFVENPELYTKMFLEWIMLVIQGIIVNTLKIRKKKTLGFVKTCAQKNYVKNVNTICCLKLHKLNYLFEKLYNFFRKRMCSVKRV